MRSRFLSTLSLRRATACIRLVWYNQGGFLSTLSLRRATQGGKGRHSRWTFLSTLSLRRATPGRFLGIHRRAFLSTLSLRRATRDQTILKVYGFGISIHALLAESDFGVPDWLKVTETISIHALLAESDKCLWRCLFMYRIFLSTLSLRRATSKDEHSDP